MKINKEQEQIGMIEMVSISKLSDKGTVESLLQKYDDGRPGKIWSVGDKTKDGIIVSFKKSETGYWYALTDTPSEWQKSNGAKNGWSWIFQLEPIDDYSIEELFNKVKTVKSVNALEVIDTYAKERSIVITRVWSPKMSGKPEQIQIFIEDNFYVFKYRTFLLFSWWSRHSTLN